MKFGVEELLVYKKAYYLAMQVFELSKGFPKEEKYSLTDQMRRSSRSVCVNLAESYRKRVYPKHFVSKLSDSDAECSETIVWLNFSRDCGYAETVAVEEIIEGYKEVGKLIGHMIQYPEKYNTVKTNLN